MIKPSRWAVSRVGLCLVGVSALCVLTAACSAPAPAAGDSGVADPAPASTPETPDNGVLTQEQSACVQSLARVYIRSWNLAQFPTLWGGNWGDPVPCAEDDGQILCSPGEWAILDGIVADLIVGRVGGDDALDVSLGGKWGENKLGFDVEFIEERHEAVATRECLQQIVRSVYGADVDDVERVFPGLLDSDGIWTARSASANMQSRQWVANESFDGERVAFDTAMVMAFGTPEFGPLDLGLYHVEAVVDTGSKFGFHLVSIRYDDALRSAFPEACALQEDINGRIAAGEPVMGLELSPAPTYDSAASPQASYGAYTVSVASGYLALRSAPAYDSANELGALYSGDAVEVLSAGGRYWYVRSERLGMSGYVNADYLVAGGSAPGALPGAGGQASAALTESGLRDVVAAYTQEPLRVFAYGDYDCDGLCEAFAVVGGSRGDDCGQAVDGDLLYVAPDGTVSWVSSDFNHYRSGEYSGPVGGGRKFFCLATTGHGSSGWSHVFTVSGGRALEVALPEAAADMFAWEGGDVFSAVEHVYSLDSGHLYVKHFLHFDESSLRFVDDGPEW